MSVKSGSRARERERVFYMDRKICRSRNRAKDMMNMGYE